MIKTCKFFKCKDLFSVKKNFPKYVVCVTPKNNNNNNAIEVMLIKFTFTRLD